MKEGVINWWAEIERQGWRTKKSVGEVGMEAGNHTGAPEVIQRMMSPWMEVAGMHTLTQDVQLNRRNRKDERIKRGSDISGLGNKDEYDEVLYLVRVWGLGEPDLTVTVPQTTLCLTEALRSHPTDSNPGLSRQPGRRLTDSRLLTLAEGRVSDLTFV